MLKSKINSKSNRKKIIRVLTFYFLSLLLSVGICYAGVSYSQSTLLSLEQPAVDTEVEAALDIQQQTRTITGRVVDSNGEPLIGVTVLVNGNPNNGANTNENGQFTLLNVDPDATLAFSYIGFVPQQIRLANRTNINVTMLEDLQTLQEVVVVGYGTQRKETLTGAVASISAAELITTRTDNVISNMQGKMPGLMVRQQNGEPGDFSNLLNIRGFGTPIVVIDGVVRNRDGLAQLAQINTEDIESISILKDASATIYGMNASNGVIIVTSKKGTTEGKARVSYSGMFGIESPTGMPDVLPAYEHKLLDREYQLNVGSPAPLSEEELAKWKAGTEPGYQTYDWLDLYMKKSVPSQNHTVSVRGGTNKVRYFTSLGYNESHGLLKNDINYYKRYSFRSNLTADLNDNLSANVMVSGRFDQRQQPTGDFVWIYKNLIVNDRGVGPYALVDGKPDPTKYTGNVPPENGNPAYAIDPVNGNGYRRNDNLNIQSSIDLTYKLPFVKGLDFNVLGSYDIRQGNQSQLNNKFHVYNFADGTPLPDNGNANYRNRIDLYNKIYGKFQINYSFKFEGHSVNISGIIEASQERYDQLQGQRPYEGTYTFDILDQASSNGATTTGNREFRRFAAQIGRINYDYQGKYLMEVVVRRDGSYRYAPSKRWVIFPSVSAGWRVSEESFFKNNISFINNMKIRASYGESGRDQGSAYEYIEAYTNTNNRGYLFSDGNFIAAMSPPGVVRDGMTWVTAKLFNTALEANFLKNKFNMIFEYFRRDNTGVLASRSSEAPNTFGASFPQENINSDMNTGFEFELKYRGRIGKYFQYSVGGNITYARVKRVYVERTPSTSQWDNWRNNNNNRYMGRGLMYDYKDIYKSLGEFETAPLSGGANGNSRMLPGTFKLIDHNGDGIINAEDQIIIWAYPPSDDAAANMYVSGEGTRVNNPPLQYGFPIEATYKDFDFTMLWQGASCYRLNFRTNEIWGYGRFPVSHSRFLDRWHLAYDSQNPENHDPKNPNAVWIPGKYPAGRTNFTGATDTNYNDTWAPLANYLRMKSIEIGYSIPKSKLRKVSIDNARIYVNGTNLLTICKKDLRQYDPERFEGNYGAGLSYPLMKAVNFGLNLTF